MPGKRCRLFPISSWTGRRLSPRKAHGVLTQNPKQLPAPPGEDAERARVRLRRVRRCCQQGHQLRLEYRLCISWPVPLQHVRRMRRCMHKHCARTLPAPVLRRRPSVSSRQRDSHDTSAAALRDHRWTLPNTTTLVFGTCSGKPHFGMRGLKTLIVRYNSGAVAARCMPMT